MGVRGYLYESFVFGRKALEVARQEGKIEDIAWLLVYGIGWREINGGDLDKGETLIREGLTIYKELKDSKDIGRALHNLGRALRFKRDFNSARQCYEEGIALSQFSSDEVAIADFKRELSLMAADEGKLIEAKEGLEAIIPILREHDELVLSGALANLASINLKLAYYTSAFEVGIESLELAKRMKKQDTIGRVSLTLAYTETARGNYQSALSFAIQALEFYERTGFNFPKQLERVKILIKELQEKLTV